LNSLFIGIGFAIPAIDAVGRWEVVAFQFPFHRDRLCNPGCLLGLVEGGERFNSLFIGIGFAIPI